MHGPRKRMGISTNEYCVLDIIYQSQVSPKYGKGGWTTIGIHKLAEFFGLSSGTVHKMLLRMAERKLLDIEGDRKRTTKLFYEAAYEKGSVQKTNVRKVNRRGSKSEQQSVQKVNASCSKSEPEYNRIEIVKESRSEVCENAHTQPVEILVDFEPFAPQTPADVVTLIARAGLNGDNLDSRRKIWEAVEPYLTSRDFKSQWSFLMSGLSGADRVNPADVVREWVTLGPYFDVKEFRINKIKNWIRTAAKTIANAKGTNSDEPRYGAAKKADLERAYRELLAEGFK